MKKTTFKINNKTYKRQPFTYNNICNLEELGIDITMLSKAKLSLVRGYIALCGGMELEVAGAEIEQHLINGGNFEEIVAIIGEELEESDFFRRLNETTKEEVTEN